MIMKLLLAPTTWRSAASAIVAALGALVLYYPMWHWITVVLAAFSVFGITVIPSAVQSAAAVKSGSPNDQ